MKSRSSRPVPRSRKRARHGILGWIARLVGGVMLFTVLWVVVYRFVPPPITATMAGDLLGGHGLTKNWMSLDEMDRDLVRAAIAGEDGKFCAHRGFDWDAIQAAAQANASGGRIRGGSTISQQTAKNVFLWQGGGYPRKAAEAWFTFLIEHLWGKRRIMEVYLNVAETGLGTYGVNAGMVRYFGHDASAVSASEAARLAAVLPLPKKRGAIAPKGFTRRYGNIIAARIGTIGRDGLDACVYSLSAPAPKDKAPPRVGRKVIVPGTDYETATPPPPSPADADAAPLAGTPPAPTAPAPAAVTPSADVTPPATPAAPDGSSDSTTAAAPAAIEPPPSN